MISTEIAIVDANVVVSGMLTKQATAATARILDGMLCGLFRFALSADLLKEYRDVLLRPAIMKLHKRSESEIDEVLTEIVSNGIVKKPAALQHEIRDPDDTHVLDLALDVKAPVVVTGDEDLLVLKVEGVRIVTPRAFVDSWAVT